jgi:hypothetical protein
MYFVIKQSVAATWPVFRSGGFGAACGCLLFFLLFPFSRLLPETRAWLALPEVHRRKLDVPDDLGDLGIEGLCHACA